jgi:hypothetical protein
MERLLAVAATAAAVDQAPQEEEIMAELDITMEQFALVAVAVALMVMEDKVAAVTVLHHL